MAKTAAKKTAAKKPGAKKSPAKKITKKIAKAAAVGASAILPLETLATPAVLDRLWAVIESRRTADPALSHSARLMSRGTAKVAQKFGEEAVECLIEAVAGNHKALVAESADVLYHLLVLWVNAGIAPGEVWAELVRREGVSGIAEKAARSPALKVETTKIP
jgi:phosphoribosyl-ATP pyrophosphohydrolase